MTSSTIEKKSAPWYNEKIKLLNKQIWTPIQSFVKKNDKNNFNSKIIEFSSFKNTLINNLNDPHNKNNSGNLKRYNITQKRFSERVITICEDKSHFHKCYVEYMNTKDSNYNNSTEYQQDPTIIYLKETLQNIQKYYEQTLQEHREFEKLNEQLNEQLTEQRLKIIDIKVNNYRTQYNEITKSYHNKCLALNRKKIKCDKKYNEYISDTYNNKLCNKKNDKYGSDTYKLNGKNIYKYINDPLIEEYRKQSLIFKAKHYKIRENYDKSIKMINKIIHSYKMKVKFK